MRNLDEYDVGWLDSEVRSVPVRAYSEKRLTASLQTESDWNTVSTNNAWLKTDGIGIIFATGDSDFQIDLIRLSNSMTKTFNALTGGSIGQIAAAYYFGDGAPDKTMSWLDYDRLGNVMGTSDVTGDQIASYHQDAYGNVLSSMNTGAWAASFSGRHLTTKEYDCDAWGYCFRDRWLRSEESCFVSRASLPFWEEHPYAYVNAQPTYYIDAFGADASLPRDGSCMTGFEPIWKCDRRKYPWPRKFGDVHHTYICCEQPDANGKVPGRCFGLQWDNRRGDRIRPEDPNEKPGVCEKTCVPTSSKTRCCDNPTAPKDYNLITYNCQTWAAECVVGGHKPFPDFSVGR